MGIPEIQIADVNLKDLKILQELSKRTFIQAFAAMNNPENFNQFLEHYYAEEKLSAEILNRDSRFFFALYRDEPVGYLKINQGMAQTVLPNDKALEIERIYIDQAYKGKGIGKRILDKAFEQAALSGAEYIWLGVWENNLPAIRFYEKCGFEKYSQHIFTLGDDDQTDWLMRFKLVQE